MRNSDEANLIRMKTLNACGESLFETKSFKEAAEKSRCIFPLHGFLNTKLVMDKKSRITFTEKIKSK
jgi:putative SOS response-associated peptidase YedK